MSAPPFYEPLRLSKMPAGPWMNVSGDFFGPMPNGQYWFVNHDEYSRWEDVEEFSSCSIEQVKPVLENLFSKI